jgi:hypothetical protein
VRRIDDNFDLDLGHPGFIIPCRQPATETSQDRVSDPAHISGRPTYSHVTGRPNSSRLLRLLARESKQILPIIGSILLGARGRAQLVQWRSPQAVNARGAARFGSTFSYIRLKKGDGQQSRLCYMAMY